MTRDEFSASYRLLKSIADAGVRSYHALDRASGDVVMVHLTDRGDQDAALAIDALIRRLSTGDRACILRQGELDGHLLLVTQVVPGFTTLTGWLTERVADHERAPVAPPRPASAAPEMPAASTPVPPSSPMLAGPFVSPNPIAPTDAPVASPAPAPFVPPVAHPAPERIVEPSAAPSVERQPTPDVASVVTTPPSPVADPPRLVATATVKPAPMPLPVQELAMRDVPVTRAVELTPTSERANSVYQSVVSAAPPPSITVSPSPSPAAPVIPARRSPANATRRVSADGEPRARLMPLLLALLLVTIVSVGVVMLVLSR
jgi:hypothetical protein